jgi:hypothetical protein
MNINKLNIIISFISTIAVFLYILFATDLALSYVLPIFIFIIVILLMVLFIKVKSK